MLFDLCDRHNIDVDVDITLSEALNLKLKNLVFIAETLSKH